MLDQGLLLHSMATWRHGNMAKYQGIEEGSLHDRSTCPSCCLHVQKKMRVWNNKKNGLLICEVNLRRSNPRCGGICHNMKSIMRVGNGETHGGRGWNYYTAAEMQILGIYIILRQAFPTVRYLQSRWPSGSHPLILHANEYYSCCPGRIPSGGIYAAQLLFETRLHP
jgi:hypothetical protein